MGVALRYLADSAEDYTVIFPNAVGPINTELGIDFVVIKNINPDLAEIHLLDCKTSYRNTKSTSDKTQFETLLSPKGTHFSNDRKRLSTQMLIKLKNHFKKRVRSPLEIAKGEEIRKVTEDFLSKVKELKDAQDPEIKNVFNIPNNREGRLLEKELWVNIRAIQDNYEANQAQ